jgi:hypothetical protein
MNVTNSEIATLLRDAANRLEVAPEPDQPKPRWRRRWGVTGVLQGLAPGEHITVIEVWPGDPTPEQVEILVTAIKRLNEVWFKSKNGELGLANEVRAQIDAAVQSFTGKESE